MKWPWSSRACGTLGIKIQIGLMLSLIVLATIFVDVSIISASTFQAGTNIQAAIDKASVGDTILVGPGQYSPFEVSKSLKIIGVDLPIVKSAVQTPGITINADHVTIFGFKIKGVSKGSTSKFDYYMQHPATEALRLDLPDAGILIGGNDAIIQSVYLSGAQVGLYADEVENLSILNTTFDHCGLGAQLLNCRGGTISNCSLSGCDKAGIHLEHSDGIKVDNNSLTETNNSAILLKETILCIVSNNMAYRKWSL